MYPSWFPYPRSWMSAFFLSVIAGGLSTAANKIADIGFYLQDLRKKGKRDWAKSL